MSTDDSPLFLRSSPLPHLSRSPDDEVPILVQRAQSVEALSPAFDSFLVSYNHAFFDLFDRQIELVKSRSQAFEDGHVTVFDKALLILTQNGNNLNNPAAVNYYCKEYLNIDIRDSAQEVTPKLQQTVEVSKALQQELSSDRTSMVQKGSGGVGKNSARLLPVNPNLRKDMEPRLAVLWSVYETARAEYLAVVDKDDNDKAIKRAKFLRDTAENILLYLKNRNADPLMIAELEGTFNHAKNTAVCLTGGRKRRFDISEMDAVKGTPLGPSLPFRKERYRGGGVSDAGAYKRHYHPDISGGYPGEMTSSYRWSSSDFPSGHGYRQLASYPDTYPCQDRDSHRFEYDAASGRYYERGYDNGEEEPVPAFGSYDAAVSSGHQDRGVSGGYGARHPSDERVSSEYSDYPDMTEHEHARSTSFRSASRKHDRFRRGDRKREDRSRRRRSRSPTIDRAYDRAYPRGREYEQERDREPDDRVDDRGRASASSGRPKMPLPGRGHSGVPYGYGSDRLVDSYVPSRDRSCSRGRGRRGRRGS